MGSVYSPDFALLFLNSNEAATVDAIAAQILPSEKGSPGAREAGVIEYIDRSLSGFMRDLQPIYREGLQELALFVAERHDSPQFVDLSDDEQNAIVAEIDELGRTQPDVFLGQFLRIIREHTVQGYFGDPAYGGNRETVGWKLVGYPGAQWGYTPEQMRPGVDARSIPILTVRDLYARVGGAK